LTVEQAGALVEWVTASGKNLTTIYVTHGHGDHFFGIGALLNCFPKARAMAMPDVVKSMRRQASSEYVSNFWNARYPGQIPERLVIAEELKGNVIQLEGRDLIVVEVGHTDTEHTTCLHVPSAGLVVAGDAAYNDVHLYLAESNAETRREWIAALDAIESLKPRAVIAGHKKPQKNDSPRIIEETRQYIRDFDRLPDDHNSQGSLRRDAAALSESSQPRGALEFGAGGQTVIPRKEQGELICAQCEQKDSGATGI
jgi:glyoxylase-like metal-dependent hydrolase (beta-lactamase superfamily II)